MKRWTKPQPVPARPIGATFAVERGDRAAGNIVRLSAVGAEIDSPWPPAVGDRIVICAELVAGEGEVALRGRVDWSTPTRFGVLLGPIGPRETYAIIRAAHRIEPPHARANSLGRLERSTGRRSLGRSLDGRIERT